MSTPMLLDCTLRDGGYVNDFHFGEKGISKIIRNLYAAGVDIIECGFLMDKPYNPNKTLFDDVALIKRFLPQNRGNSMFVAMIAYGDIPLDKIAPCDGTSITGIRVTFHKPQMEEALRFATAIKAKGYQVFVQPVGTTSYSEEELLDLVEKVNDIRPFAFYIVDTLSILYKQSITRMFRLVNKHLRKSIRIGYHSHNNLQLAFANAQEMVNMAGKRSIILDSSVFGMGRGAGNLCTELIVDFLNNTCDTHYDTIPILELLDGEISRNYSKTPWGYNTPYFLASIHKCHPNYASFLLSKQTISAKNINDILNQIAPQKRDLYDKAYIEKLYINYLANDIDDADGLRQIAHLLDGKEVLVLGAGTSIIDYADQIRDFIHKNNPYVIAVNFVDSALDFGAQMGFFSNSKKFEAIENCEHKTLVVTSSILKHIKHDDVLAVNFSSLLLSNQNVFDNAGLMLIKLLANVGVKHVYLAGFDGFTNEASDYIKQQLFFNPEREEIIEARNSGMRSEIQILRGRIAIDFITPTLYE